MHFDSQLILHFNFFRAKRFPNALFCRWHVVGRHGLQTAVLGLSDVASGLMGGAAFCLVSFWHPSPAGNLIENKATILPVVRGWPGRMPAACIYGFTPQTLSSACVHARFGNFSALRKSSAITHRWFSKVFGLNQVPFMAGFSCTQKLLLAKAMEVAEQWM